MVNLNLMSMKQENTVLGVFIINEKESARKDRWQKMKLIIPCKKYNLEEIK